MPTMAARGCSMASGEQPDNYMISNGSTPSPTIDLLHDANANPYAWRNLVVAALFCCACIGLDWMGTGGAFNQLHVSAWNPSSALVILYLICRGPGGAFIVYAALVSGDLLVQDVLASAGAVLLVNLVLTAGFTGMAWALRRYAGEGGMFVDLRSLARWCAIVVIGSLANALLFVVGLAYFGLMPVAEWMTAITQLWIGDSVGIVIGVPLLWWVLDQRRRRQFLGTILHWETLVYVAVAVIMLYLALGPTTMANFRYLYILFFPLGWAASRQGLVGAIFCAALLQVGMLLAGWLWGLAGGSMFEIQLRGLVLAGVGFLIGVAVDEQKRAVLELRQSLRLAAAGEMAAALAHELNQPLTALSAYGSAIEHLLRRDGGSEQLRDAVRRMVGEAGRAAEVVRRLRDFFRTGTTHLELVTLRDLLDAALKNFVESAPKLGVELIVDPAPDVMLQIDHLEIEVVLRNLLSNAFEALPTGAEAVRKVYVTTAVQGDVLGVIVEDSGAGVSAAMSDGTFEPFVSTKSNGLGLGLAISRAIAEAHGGRLIAEARGHGRFTLFLPVHRSREESIG